MSVRTAARPLPRALMKSHSFVLFGCSCLFFEIFPLETIQRILLPIIQAHQKKCIKSWLNLSTASFAIEKLRLRLLVRLEKNHKEPSQTCEEHDPRIERHIAEEVLMKRMPRVSKGPKTLACFQQTNESDVDSHK